MENNKKKIVIFLIGLDRVLSLKAYRILIADVIKYFIVTNNINGYNHLRVM